LSDPVPSIVSRGQHLCRKSIAYRFKLPFLNVLAPRTSISMPPPFKRIPQPAILTEKYRAKGMFSLLRLY